MSLSEFKHMQNLEAERELQHRLNAHGDQQFDFGSLPADTRRILRQGGISISAASTIGGMLDSDVKKILDRSFASYPVNNEPGMRIKVKLDLMAAGALLNVKA
jgi:hypothetical protein